MQDPASFKPSAAADTQQAFAEACPLIYENLRKLSRRYLGRRNIADSICPTELVNEALSRLWEQQVVARDPLHLHAICARQMRYVLIDQARARLRVKRSGDCDRLDTGIVNGPLTNGGVNIIELDSCLRRLEEIDVTAAKAVELHYFGGHDVIAVAALLGISSSTVTRKLRISKAWLLSQLGAG
jgi:RNA polymerase sigma factor (TIGR02999 family)